MNQSFLTVPEKNLVGIRVRTNNRLEVNPETGKILNTLQQYFEQKLFESIQHRLKPGTTFCCYTDYESDHTGDYTYFVGEEVGSFDNQPTNLDRLIIPAQSYSLFTTNPAPMPDVIRNAWFSIWKMNDSDFGGKRKYHTDFEIYDERAANPQKAIVDIYIGIEK
ncbi:MAG: GyrI-like domain-containing protein [Gammaproteobacteria bacterium]